MDVDKPVWVVLGLLIFIFVGVIFASCNQGQHPEIIIDGCEYVRDHNSLAHKGNCRQCEERLRKILREEINEILR